MAHAAYVRTGPDRAEVAFMVADAWQGHGIATIMLGHLAAAAEEHGIAVFTAEVLPSNHRMIQRVPRQRVRRGAALRGRRDRSRTADLALRADAGTLRAARADRGGRRGAAVPAPTLGRGHRRLAQAPDGRRRAAAQPSPDGLLGRVYPVNRRVRTIQGKRAYGSIAELPEPVDLAVIAVPAAQVCAVARECQSAGVRALLVISAGFAETGEEGARRQQELLAICREAGMRLIGPNCLGVLNTATGVRLNATFAGALAAARLDRLPLPERRPRHRDHRGRQPHGPRPVVVRVGRQQGRRLRQRPARVLGARPRHRRRPAVPRVLRQPAPLRADRAPGGPGQADRRGQERPLAGRSARHLLAHRRAALEPRT